MPWKFFCDFRFQTTIIRQITKENEEIEKNRKIQSKTVGIVYRSLCVLVSEFFTVILVYHTTLAYLR